MDTTKLTQWQTEMLPWPENHLGIKFTDAEWHLFFAACKSNTDMRDCVAKFQQLAAARGTFARVMVLPKCDINAEHGDAQYDASTAMGWGFLCEACFALHGRGLGLGVGQRLIVRPS